MAAKKKLTPEQVQSIREDRKNKVSQASLAIKHNVHTSTIRAVENGSGAYAGQ